MLGATLVRVCVYMYVCIYTYMCIYIYMCIYTCIYTCAFVLLVYQLDFSLSLNTIEPVETSRLLNIQQPARSTITQLSTTYFDKKDLNLSDVDITLHQGTAALVNQAHVKHTRCRIGGGGLQISNNSIGPRETYEVQDGGIDIK